MDTKKVAKLIFQWALKKPQIAKVQFFGSRVKGTHHKDSDLDIAITLINNLGESGGLSTWIFNSEEWAAELGVIIPCKVDLQWDGKEETPTIGVALNEASCVVYEKDL